MIAYMIYEFSKKCPVKEPRNSNALGALGQTNSLWSEENKVDSDYCLTQSLPVSSMQCFQLAA